MQLDYSTTTLIEKLINRKPFQQWMENDDWVEETIRLFAKIYPDEERDKFLKGIRKFYAEIFDDKLHYESAAIDCLPGLLERVDSPERFMYYLHGYTVESYTRRVFSGLYSYSQGYAAWRLDDAANILNFAMDLSQIKQQEFDLSHLYKEYEKRRCTFNKFHPQGWENHADEEALKIAGGVILRDYITHFRYNSPKPQYLDQELMQLLGLSIFDERAFPDS